MAQVISSTEGNNNKIQYMYQINGQGFCSYDIPLSNFKANFFMGRATHVIKVFNINEWHCKYALCSSWLPIDVKMDVREL